MPRHLSLAVFLVYSGALAAVAVHGWWIAFAIIAGAGAAGGAVYMVSNRARQARRDHDPVA